MSLAPLTSARARAVWSLFVVTALAWAIDARADAIELTVDAFERDVLRDRSPWVVAFTSSRECEICEYVGQAYAKAANAKATEVLGVKFGVLDVSRAMDSMEKLSELVAIRTIPMVLAYPTYATENPYDRKRSAKIPAAFPLAGADGRVNELSARSFTAFAEKALPTHLIERVEITGDVVSEGVLKGDGAMPTAVLLSDKATTSSLLKSISHELEGRMRIVEVVYPSSAARLPRLPGVDESQSPRLVVYPSGSSTPVLFDSETLKSELVREFLTSHAGPIVELKLEIRSDNPKAKTAKKSEEEVYVPQSTLAPLRGADFKSTVMDDAAYHVVAFTKSDDSCDKIVKVLSTRLEAFRGIIKLHEVIVGGADEQANALLKDGSLKLFADETKCVEIVAFPESDEGAARDVEFFRPSITTSANGYSADALATFVMSNIIDLTLQVDAKNIDRVFLGQNQRKPKILLFINEGDQESYDAARLLSSVHKDFNFGVTTSTDKELVEQFQVKKRPELVAISRKNDEEQSKEGVRVSIHKYPAQVFMPQIANAWIEQLRTIIYGVDTASIKIPSPAMVDSQQQFNDECAEKGGLCVIAHVKDGNPAHVAIFHELAKSLHGKPFHFVIIDPSTQRTFASVFEVNNPVDYPTITVISARQQRAITHKEAFELPLIKEFCENVLNGKLKTWRFQEMPVLVSGGEVAEESVEEIIEEEFDLNDIMGVEVEGSVALSREEIALKAAKEEAEAEARKSAEKAAKAAEEAAKLKKLMKKKMKLKKKRAAARSEL